MGRGVKLLLVGLLFLGSINIQAEEIEGVNVSNQDEEKIKQTFKRKAEKLSVFNKISQNHFGVLANNPTVIELAKFTPLPEHTPNKSDYVTFNRMGVDIISSNEDNTNNWLIKEFIEHAKSNNSVLLDIGSGFGGASLKALEQGARVVANDLDLENLLFLVNNIRNPLLLNKLYLNLDSFPEQTDFPYQSFRGILAYRVFQYLNGTQIEQGVYKMAQWLGQGDKVFLAVICPQNHRMVDKILPLYEQKWENGNIWPGESTPTEQASSTPNAVKDNYIHVMDEKPLKVVFEKYGFKLEKSGFIARNYIKNGRSFNDNKALVGMILVKQ